MVFGFCVLFAGPLFTGPSRLFLSAPFLPAAIPMLAPFGFDNVTSSVFV